MFTICGYNFCKDGNALDPMPIHANSYTTTRLSNGLFDNWWVSRDVSSAYSSTIPTTWDYLTVMNANFNGNINAGNIASTLSGIDGFKIKRRIVGTYDWVTLKFVDVASIQNLSFAFQDNLAASGVRYEYAFVPVTGGVDGDYSSSIIDTKFNGVFICDLDTIYRFYAGVSYGSQQRVHKVGTLEPFGRKYPVIVSNSVINYDTGSVSGTIMPPDYIDTHILDRHIMAQEHSQLLDFLTNKKAKMLKDYNGNEWLMVITTSPSLSYANNWGQGLADFTAQWEEIGDANKQSDLVSTGIVSDDYTSSSIKGNISDAVVTLGAQIHYTGQEQVQTISSVVYGSTNLIPNADYTVTGNVGTNIGTYTMTLTGIGKYRGTKTVQWSIVGTMPSKGDLITMTLGNSAADVGMQNVYRVLSVDGGNVLALSMFGYSDVEFDDESNVYDGSNLDTYLNTTWYNSLSSSAKSAIIDSSIETHSYFYSDTPNEPNTPTYTYQYQYNWYDDDYENLQLFYTAQPITRKVYALDIKEVYDYLNKRCITSNELNQMFFNQTSSIESRYPWLRSASSETNESWYVSGSSGYFSYDDVDSTGDVHPALKINLTQIPWHTYNGNIADSTVVLGAQLVYTGSQQTQTISSVTYGDTILVEGTDYTISGNTGTNVGTYTMTITGIGGYVGTKTVQWTIAPAQTTTITWDGDTTGKTVVQSSSTESYCRVSALTPTASDVIGGTVHSSTGGVAEITSGVVVDETDTIAIASSIIIAKRDNAQMESLTFPQAGIYFYKSSSIYVSKLEY